MLRLFSILLILLAFPSLSNAHYPPGCGENHSKLPIKTHAQQFVEDSSAPKSQRIKAMECLIYYGRRGVPILTRVLERKSDNLKGYALQALSQIQDKSVMEPMFRLLGYDSKGNEQSGADSDSTSSSKEWAVGILTELAFTSLDKPNDPPPTNEELIIRWAGKFESLYRQYYYEGELLGGYEINRISAVLKKIAESEMEDTTEREKRVIRAAAKGLTRLEERMALLKKYGTNSYYMPFSIAFDTLDFHCPAPGDRLTFYYGRGEGAIACPLFAQIQIKSPNNILPFSLSEFGEPPSDPRPFCRNPFHNR